VHNIAAHGGGAPGYTGFGTDTHGTGPVSLVIVVMRFGLLAG
jgi:hypothetical protein